MAREHLLAGWRARVRGDERAVAADPEQAALGGPPAGTPVAVESGDGTILHAELLPDRPTIVLIHGGSAVGHTRPQHRVEAAARASME